MAEQVTCKRCGKEIPEDRLTVLPDTELCTECSKQVGGDYELVSVPGSIAKAGSMKRNYGEWNLKKKRRTIPPKPEA